MHFITGILMIGAGYYIWRGIQPKRSALQRQRDLHQRARHQKQMELITSLTQEKELNYQVTIDAVNRENRAKAALVKVLNASGCSEAQIEEVLAGIDEGG